MSTDSRAGRVFGAHLHYLHTLAQRGGGGCSHDDGTVAIANVHSLPFLVNVCARHDPNVASDVVLDRAHAFFSSRGRDQYEVLALLGRDEDLLSAAAERGMHVSYDPEPLQLLDHPLPLAPNALGADLEVRWAKTPLDVEHVAQVAHDAHRAYGFPDDLFPALFEAPGTVLDADLSAVLISRDGQPVATAQVQVNEDTAYIGWVAVCPSAGRMGLGATVTRLAVERGFEEGASAAVLLASPMGAPVYRRLGFHDVGGAASARPPGI